MKIRPIDVFGVPVVAVLCVSLLAAVAAAQQADDESPDAWALPDDIGPVLEGLSVEELAKLVDEAARARLQVERQQVAAEIRQGLLYDNADIRKALALLAASPAETQADNIDRIMKAFAAVDERFAGPFELFAAGKHAEALEPAQAIVNDKQTTYLSAAGHYLLAETLRQAGNDHEAIEVYSRILANMPDRISFAAASAVRAAEVYEKLHRGTYAMEMSVYCLTNYGLTLSKEDFDAILDRIEQLKELYADPIGSIVGRMQQVRDRLAAADSGDETRKAQEQIVMVLEDLIKTAEEKSKSSGQKNQQSQQRNQQGRCPKCGRKDCQGQCRGGVGTSMGRPGRTDQPSSPAQTSALVPGAVERPVRQSSEHLVAESDDWAKLPPRERMRLKQISRKTLSERHRDIISDYRTRLAEGENR